MIASESMTSSFQDFPAENFASCSPDDSHFISETIFSCFYFSTLLGEPLLFMWSTFPSSCVLWGEAPRGSSWEQSLHIIPPFVCSTAKPQHSWGWQQQVLSPWRQIMESKQAKENQIHSGSSECLQGHSQAALGKGLMIWTPKHNHAANTEAVVYNWAIENMRKLLQYVRVNLTPRHEVTSLLRSHSFEKNGRH